MGRRCFHSTPHNHEYVRFTTGSLSVSTRKAFDRGSVFYPSVVLVLFFATSAPFIYYTLSDWVSVAGWLCQYPGIKLALIFSRRFGCDVYTSSATSPPRQTLSNPVSFGYLVWPTVSCPFFIRMEFAVFVIPTIFVISAKGHIRHFSSMTDASNYLMEILRHCFLPHQSPLAKCKQSDGAPGIQDIGRYASLPLFCMPETFQRT